MSEAMHSKPSCAKARTQGHLPRLRNCAAGANALAELAKRQQPATCACTRVPQGAEQHTHTAKVALRWRR
eukprot:7357790-Alexandrium_andersonii.AAC.1